MGEKQSTVKIATEDGVFEFRVPGHVKAIQVNGEEVDATPKMIRTKGPGPNPLLPNPFTSFKSELHKDWEASSGDAVLGAYFSLPKEKK